MGIYNILSCKGWEVGTSYIQAGGCMKARLGLVFLFFVIAIIRKWGGEEVGLEYSFLFGLILGLVPYFLVVTFTGSFKIAMVVGLAGAIIGGYLLGSIFGGGE